MYKWSIWQPLRIQYTNDKSAIKMSIQKFWTPPLLDPTDYIKSATNLIIDSNIRLHKCVFMSKKMMCRYALDSELARKKCEIDSKNPTNQFLNACVDESWSHHWRVCPINKNTPNWESGFIFTFREIQDRSTSPTNSEHEWDFKINMYWDRSNECQTNRQP